MPTPDSLQPGNIPGQNPNTPERMPGHTATPRRSDWPSLAPWVLASVLIALLGLYALGVIGH